MLLRRSVFSERFCGSGRVRSEAGECFDVEEIEFFFKFVYASSLLEGRFIHYNRVRFGLRTCIKRQGFTYHRCTTFR